MHPSEQGSEKKTGTQNDLCLLMHFVMSAETMSGVSGNVELFRECRVLTSSFLEISATLEYTLPQDKQFLKFLVLDGLHADLLPPPLSVLLLSDVVGFVQHGLRLPCRWVIPFHDRTTEPCGKALTVAVVGHGVRTFWRSVKRKGRAGTCRD